ncbi:MAG TPA: type II toxin-antitoxin system RelE/ParE family toxin [Chloroflexota bacterium]|jgi:addiction module RelE/StbE family toxin
MQVLWLEQAEADLRELSDYLLERSPGAALRTYEAIRESVAHLADHPGMGRPGRVAGTRELVIARTPYIVAYTVDQDLSSVIVLRVLHGAGRWPGEFSAS